MRLTRLHSPNSFDVTFVQCCPPSRVTCTSPSSVPAQITPFSTGDSAIVNTVSSYSTLVLSWVTGPPEDCCLLLSFRVKSPLIAVQLIPPSVVLKTASPP